MAPGQMSTLPDPCSGNVHIRRLPELWDVSARTLYVRVPRGEYTVTHLELLSVEEMSQWLRHRGVKTKRSVLEHDVDEYGRRYVALSMLQAVELKRCAFRYAFLHRTVDVLRI